MREIKFRGRKLQGGWISGYLMQRELDTGRFFIRVLNAENYPPRYTDYEVESKTVGQYTGKIKDGVEIYEGDILFDGIDKYKVIWLDGGWVMESIEYGDIVRLSAANLEEGFKVIGNINEQ